MSERVSEREREREQENESERERARERDVRVCQRDMCVADVMQS